MKNQSKIRKTIIRPLLVLFLGVGTLMPLEVYTQEGGRTRSTPRVTCETTVYDLLLFTLVVTECTDGTRTVSLA